ncbi:hypothetical protein Ddc_19803 [Ditylenchus destructor]|nr:hypothetical protein Ddc_19803 [Ditylenchus destructor]
MFKFVFSMLVFFLIAQVMIEACPARIKKMDQTECNVLANDPTQCPEGQTCIQEESIGLRGVCRDQEKNDG